MVLGGGGSAAPAGSGSGAPAAAVAPPSPPSPAARVTPAMVRLLTLFEGWARGNAGAPCPTADTLDPAAKDPWNKPFVVTCTEQPGSHRVGVVSGGPDGALGTDDDLPSWALGTEVTSLARGPRWVAAAAPAAAPPPADPTAVPKDRDGERARVRAPSRPSTAPKPTSRPAKPPVRSDAGSKPAVQFDEDGLPIGR
jgi:hypothetical protein